MDLTVTWSTAAAWCSNIGLPRAMSWCNGVQRKAVPHQLQRMQLAMLCDRQRSSASPLAMDHCTEYRSATRDSVAAILGQLLSMFMMVSGMPLQARLTSSAVSQKASTLHTYNTRQHNRLCYRGPRPGSQSTQAHNSQ